MHVYLPGVCVCVCVCELSVCMCVNVKLFANLLRMCMIEECVYKILMQVIKIVYANLACICF